MKIYPAIDIKDGKCVRLKQGKFDDVTVFSNEPFEIAKKWQSLGASFIHVVDLDGARMGSGYNTEAIKKILENVSVPIQVGGGIRNMDDIEQKLSLGVSRVILGTAAINSPSFVEQAVNKYGNKIAVGIDAKDGLAAACGWEQLSSIKALDLCRNMERLGVKTIIYTDISKDGMMQGVNIPATKEIIDMLKGTVDIIASGGISCMEDLQAVSEINASGVIIGKALYSKAVELNEAICKFERD